MNKLKLISKGLLLHMTVLFTLLFVIAIDSIYDNGWFIQSIIICVTLIYACYKFISKEELETLTLCKYFGISIKEE